MDQVIQKKLSYFLRAWKFTCRHTLGRRLPHGVVSLRYLLPSQPSKIKIHKRLWLRGLPQVPLPLYIVMEFFLYLRWVLFSGWLGALKLARLRGPEIKDREGIGTLTQFKRVLFAALFQCIPPAEFYAFSLYRQNRKLFIWDYIFTHELPAFHRWRGLKLGETAESLHLLGDKYLSAKVVSKHGVPVVPNLEMVPRGSEFDFSTYLHKYSRLFCKPRNGSAGRDCFVVEKQEADTKLIIYSTESGIVKKQSTWSCLAKASEQDDYLVQPVMENHPALTGLGDKEDAVTIRIITETRDLKTIHVYTAMMEIPGLEKDSEGEKGHEAVTQFHAILPINPATGKTMFLPKEHLASSARERYESMYAKVGQSAIPFWRQLQESALASHTLFSDVYAIAWDYVVTPDGPFLLEGNTGWATRMPQIINGGLLSLCK